MRKKHAILLAGALLGLCLATTAVAQVNMTGYTNVEATADSGLVAAPSDCGPACCCDPCADCGPRWTVRAEGLMMGRSKPDNFALVTDTSTPGNDLFDTNDFNFNFAAGPQITLLRHGECGWDLEARYFGIDAWNSTAIFPASSGTHRVYTAQNSSVGARETTLSYGSELFNTELNVRRRIGDRLSVLAGFRWTELGEDYSATGTNTLSNPYSHHIQTSNHLYGFQIGADGTLWDRGGPFRVDGVMKAGAFGNAARYTADYTNGAILRDLDSRESHTSFIGELGLTAVYDIGCHWAARAGYQLMWIEGVALAPEQIAATRTVNGEFVADVDMSGSPFYHGFWVGLEHNW